MSLETKSDVTERSIVSYDSKSRADSTTEL
jgi:hypothetical protein